MLDVVPVDAIEDRLQLCSIPRGIVEVYGDLTDVRFCVNGLAALKSLACEQVDPLACRQVNVALKGFLAQYWSYEQALAKQEFVLYVVNVCIVHVIENEVTYGRHTRVARDLGILLHIGDELGVQTRVVTVDLLCILGHLVSVTNVTVCLHLCQEGGEFQSTYENSGLLLLADLVVIGAVVSIAGHIEGHIRQSGQTAVDGCKELVIKLDVVARLVARPHVGVTLRADAAAAYKDHKAVLKSLLGLELDHLFVECGNEIYGVCVVLGAGSDELGLLPLIVRFGNTDLLFALGHNLAEVDLNAVHTHLDHLAPDLAEVPLNSLVVGDIEVVTGSAHTAS